MKLTERPPEEGGEDRDGEEAPVLVEPKPGYADEDVVEMLHRLGASRVDQMAPGFVSARATPEARRALEEIARVHLKREKTPRR